MSPEQAKGLDADQRSDIFSFGAVLYEMLTGRHSFQGENITEVIASVLARPPDLTALPANINPRIEDLIRRCLEKDVKRRRQAIADVRVEIESLLADPHGLKLPAVRVIGHRSGNGRFPSSRPRPLPWASPLPPYGVCGRHRRRASHVSRSCFLKVRGLRGPAGTSWRFPPMGPRSVRGQQSAVLAQHGGDGLRPIQGKELDVDSPFFSPDGQWVGFHSNTEGRLKKVAITGGASVTICDAQIPFGASWGEDGQILIGAGAGGILRVSSNGGKSETVATVEDGEQAQSPQLLPGGDAILFTLSKAAQSTLDRWDRAQIVVQSLKSGERMVLMEGGSNARYVTYRASRVHPWLDIARRSVRRRRSSTDWWASAGAGRSVQSGGRRWSRAFRVLGEWRFDLRSGNGGGRHRSDSFPGRSRWRTNATQPSAGQLRAPTDLAGREAVGRADRRWEGDCRLGVQSGRHDDDSTLDHWQRRQSLSDVESRWPANCLSVQPGRGCSVVLAASRWARGRGTSDQSRKQGPATLPGFLVP